MSVLRVLHVNTADWDGGAARAANRVHQALRKAGIDSSLLTIDRRENAPYVLRPLSVASRAAHRIKLAASRRIMALQVTPTNPVLHSLNLFSNGLADWINRSNFDIVNLHWIAGEMLSIEEIGRIAKPICWTLHDMWPFSGAEHYDDLEYPERYRSGYTKANRPPGYSGPDLDTWVWRRKQKAWAGKLFQLISPSHWLAECAARSQLMGHQPCVVIANCVDTDIFKPIDRRQARTIFNLDPGKRYILFGAMSSTSDRRKGFHLLQPALQRLALRPEIAMDTELLIFGAHPPIQLCDLGFPARFLGNLHDEVSLALLYSAADVFVAPSLQDNLPNTLVESLACGTPCVAFLLGGMPDLIRHRETGWLAAAGNINDLVEGLYYVLSVPIEREAVRQSAITNFNGNRVASEYLRCYLSHINARETP